MYLKDYIQKLVKNDPAVSEKNFFSFSYINGLGSRSRNDLDLQYSHTFINSTSSHAAVVSEKSTVFTFSYRRA